MGRKPRKSTASSETPTTLAATELPERWSAQRKADLVMRLLRGEALDAVSRESQVPAHELESWKRVFLETGARGLKSRLEPEERGSSWPSSSSKQGALRTSGRSRSDEGLGEPE